jgi:hypothetical protein
MRPFPVLLPLYALFVLTTPVRAQSVAAACPKGGNPSDIYVSSFGARPDGDTDSTDAINQALACAVTSTAAPVNVHFDSGAYLAKCSNKSNTSCFVLDGSKQQQTKGINISGQGSGATTILIGNPYSGGFLVKNASSINISGLTIDYVTPPFVQGTIVAVNHDSFDFKVLPGAMQAIPQNLCDAYGRGQDDVDVSPDGSLGISPRSSRGMVMDSSNGKSVKHNALPGAVIFPTSCSRIGSRVWRIRVHKDVLTFISKGDNYVHVIGSSFKKTGFWLDTSKYLSIRDVIIRSGGGFATLFTNNEGTIYLDKVQVRFAPNSNRFLTTAADAVHLQHNWAKPVIENSYFEGMADDAINIYSVALFASGASSDGKSLEVRAIRPVHVGDSIEVLSASDGTLRGAATVTSISLGRGAGRLALRVNPAVAGVSANPSDNGGDIVFDVSAAGPGSVIRNNTFGRHRGRDIVDRSPYSLIANNKFLDANWNAIDLTASVGGAAKEGPTAHGVTISGNQIYGGDLPWGALIAGRGLVPKSRTSYGPAQISILNNSMSSSVEKDVGINAANQLTIKNNEFLSLSCGTPRIDTANSRAVNVSGNSCSGAP